MDALRRKLEDLQRQTYAIQVELDKECVVQEWFDADFVRNLVGKESLTHEFKRREHDVTSDQDF